jgi:hypothetical protein
MVIHRPPGIYPPRQNLSISAQTEARITTLLSGQTVIHALVALKAEGGYDKLNHQQRTELVHLAERIKRGGSSEQTAAYVTPEV